MKVTMRLHLLHTASWVPTRDGEPLTFSEVSCLVRGIFRPNASVSHTRMSGFPPHENIIQGGRVITDLRKKQV